MLKRHLLLTVQRSSSWLVASLVLTSSLQADLISIGPFIGDRSENFSSFPGGTGNMSSLDIFGGDVSLATTNNGSIKIEFSSLRDGDQVVPYSPPVMMGHFHPLEWHFHTPISQFGGFFENNSRFDDIEISFYNSQDNLIGTVVANAPKADQVWTWNGWRSNVLVSRITTAGFDVAFLSGFVWYDNMEISYAVVPEPSAAMLLLAGLVGYTVGIRKRKIQCI